MSEAINDDTEAGHADGLDSIRSFIFCIQLEREGASIESAWNELIGSIADAPSEIIGPLNCHLGWEPETETNAERVQRMIDGEYTNDTVDNIDLVLADILLLCDREGWDFEHFYQQARNIYLRELGQAKAESSDPDDLYDLIGTGTVRGAEPESRFDDNDQPTIPFYDSVKAHERSIISAELKRQRGSITRAAKALGMAHQALAYIINQRHPELLSERAPIKKRRKSILKKR